MNPAVHLDPRRSVALAVGGAVALPGLALAAVQPPTAVSAVAVLVLAMAAATLARRPWRALTATLATRAADDLSPLHEPAAAESRAVVHGLNRLLAQQRETMDHHKRFLADASHQLRTPLAVLRTQLQCGPASALASEMLRTLDRATAVADELLARMKLEQRVAARAALQPLRVDEVAQEAALEFAPLIAERRLEFHLDALPLAVPADAWMLGELVRNLLANAVRHTPRGAALTVVVRRAAGCVELIVGDSGPGIADDLRERLFEPFAAATGGTGVGLGLSICRQLAQAMGAEVQLFNRSDGERVVGVDAVVRWPAESVTSNPQPQPRSSTGDIA